MPGVNEILSRADSAADRSKIIRLIELWSGCKGNDCKPPSRSRIGIYFRGKDEPQFKVEVGGTDRPGNVIVHLLSEPHQQRIPPEKLDAHLKRLEKLPGFESNEIGQVGQPGRKYPSCPISKYTDDDLKLLVKVYQQLLEE